MPEVSPFIAASPGAMQHLAQNPLVQAALKQGVFKDIWGSEYATFMGQDMGAGGISGEIPDSTQGRIRAFAADVAVYRCVDLRGAAIASVPLKIYDSIDLTKRREVEHEAMGVLQQTNPYHWVAGAQLMRYSLGSRDLHGAFAWHVVPDKGSRLRAPLPRELYWIPPGQYTPVAGADLDPPQPKIPFAGLKVRSGQGQRERFIPASELVYGPTYNPVDPNKGTSRITALLADLNLRLYGANSNLWFFRNNQRPDVVVTGAFSPTPENVGLMRRIWKAAFGGDGNRGPAFLPSDMRVNLLTMTQKDAEWLGQRQAAREDILAAFGVPPPVYGDLSRATYENIRVAYEAFWRTGMIPELDDMAAVLTQQFLWKWPDALKQGLVFSFDYAAIEALQEDANAIWERTMQMVDRLNAAVTHRSLLPNQMRQLAQQLFKAAGLPDKPWGGDVPGGDMFYSHLNEIPIIEASVQANVDAQAARAGITNGETSKPGDGKWVLPDARDVTGDPTEPPPAPLPIPGAEPAKPQPAIEPPPAPAAPKMIIHNHLTRLEWPQLPALPGDLDGGDGEHHAQRHRDQARNAGHRNGEQVSFGVKTPLGPTHSASENGLPPAVDEDHRSGDDHRDHEGGVVVGLDEEADQGQPRESSPGCAQTDAQRRLEASARTAKVAKDDMADGGDSQANAQEYHQRVERDHRVHPSMRAHDWLVRRLKRHFQDQQTSALRAVRAEQVQPVESWVNEGTRQAMLRILKDAAEMAQLSGDQVALEQIADDVHRQTLDQVLGLLDVEMSRRDMQDRIRDVFREAIDVRSHEIASDLLGLGVAA